MEFLSVVRNAQSYSLPFSTTFPKQLKFSLCFLPICKSRNCLLSEILLHTHCRAGSFIDFLCASCGASGASPVPVEAGSFEARSVEVPAVEVEATAVCDLVVLCDAAVAMVVVVVVTVIDVSPVVTVSAAVTVSDVLVSGADFLGEGSQPFSKGRECFHECPVTIVSSRDNATFSVSSVSVVPNLKLQLLPTVSAASKCSIMLLSPLFNRHFLGTNADNCFSPSKECDIFLRIGSPFLMTSATHHRRKGVKWFHPLYMRRILKS